MDTNCKNANTNEPTPACVPFFLHENTMMHYNIANKRMLTALIAVCITFVLTIVIFVYGYTIRERNWLRTLTEMTTPTATEVSIGAVHEPGD